MWANGCGQFHNYTNGCNKLPRKRKPSALFTTGYMHPVANEFDRLNWVQKPASCEYVLFTWLPLPWCRTCKLPFWQYNQTRSWSGGLMLAPTNTFKFVWRTSFNWKKKCKQSIMSTRKWEAVAHVLLFDSTAEWHMTVPLRCMLNLLYHCATFHLGIMIFNEVTNSTNMLVRTSMS